MLSEVHITSYHTLWNGTPLYGVAAHIYLIIQHERQTHL